MLSLILQLIATIAAGIICTTLAILYELIKLIPLQLIVVILIIIFISVLLKLRK
jgi:hypothetical protein